jgi:hypothetical protein
MSRFLVFILFVFTNCNSNDRLPYQPKPVATTGQQNTGIDKKLRQRINVAATYTRRNKYNTEFCFLVDMNIPSGQKRFFVYSFKQKKIIASGLVAHGSCNTGGLMQAKFSNETGSGCSSVGKYKIGYPYNGRFGKAYKLHGLENSNANAFDRAVVLHSYECVPDDEVAGLPICNSLGCPMVSPKFLTTLSSFIDGSKKPILLWVFE